MATNNNNKAPNVPPLRFPEFKGEWKYSPLNEYLTENKERNKKGHFNKTDVLSVSGDFGIVNQIQLLGRSFAGKSVLDYHVVRYGNIVYTKSPLKEYPYGIVKINKGADGIVSTLYAVYNVKTNAYGKFIESYFALPRRTNKYFKPIVRIGAKHDMKISNAEAIANIVCFPQYAEQQKIAEFLSLLDERISTQNKIIEKLQSLIKGLNDHILKNIEGDQVCFADLGEAYGGLSGKSGDDFGCGDPFITYMNVYQNTYISENDYELVQIAPDEKQNSVQYGDALFTLSSETPEEVGMGAVYLGKSQKLYLNSFCFGVHFHGNRVLPQYIAHFISSTSFRKAIYPLAQGSTRFNLQKQDFMRMKFVLPSLEEQERIATALDALHNYLANEKLLTEQYLLLKQFLLQQMFI